MALKFSETFETLQGFIRGEKRYNMACRILDMNFTFHDATCLIYSKDWRQHANRVTIREIALYFNVRRTTFVDMLLHCFRY